ncbi:MAG: retropepsin-like aspartic protease [Maricaulis sp.]|nr:retropepsin-like aspartic protease [Maricaulis sp.]
MRNRRAGFFAALLATCCLTTPGSAQHAECTTDAVLTELRHAWAFNHLTEATANTDCISVEMELSRHVAAVLAGAGQNGLLALENWLQLTAALNDEQLAFGFNLLAARAHLETRYSDSAYFAELALSHADEEDRADITDALQLARVARNIPASTSTGESGTRVEARLDLAQLLRTTVGLGDDIALDMIIDTGAEISVIANRVAITAGLEFLDGNIRVGTPTDYVTGQLAVADEITIGEMTVSNVVFLVLPDAMLSLADGAYTIEGIIGLQVFRTLGRMGWERQGESLLLGDAVDRLAIRDTPIFWHDEGVGLIVETNAIAGPALFDSGASRTLFRHGLVDALTEPQTRQLMERADSVTALGGTEDIVVQTLGELTMRIGGANLSYENIAINAEDEDIPAADFASVGNDAVRQSESFSIDFGRMRYRRVASD